MRVVDIDMISAILAKAATFLDQIILAIIGFLGGVITHLQSVKAKKTRFSFLAAFVAGNTSSVVALTCFAILVHGLNMKIELAFWLSTFISYFMADKAKAMVEGWIEGRFKQ